MTTKIRHGYVSRTIQGLFEADGGYSTPITMKRLMAEGEKLELFVGDGKWEAIDRIKISFPNGDDVMIICGDTGYTARYGDAVRSRVRKEAE